MDKLIVNVALTGCVHHKHQNEALPVTAEEIAADVVRCANAGATMFHVHVRGQAGNSSMTPYLYSSTARAIRDRTPEAVLIASCSGRRARSFSLRAGPILKTDGLYDMGSLTTGSFNFPQEVSHNDPAMIRALAKAMKENGMKPEIECFEVGHVANAAKMYEDGLIERLTWYNFILGNSGSAPAYFPALKLMREMAGPDVFWAGGGIGKNQFRVNLWALTEGGHVRVGLEDGLWMEKGVPATNVAMVERIVEHGRAMGREPATLAETRKALRLEARE